MILTTTPSTLVTGIYIARVTKMMKQTGYLGDYTGDGSGSSCQDCGNQAKKECEHMRCRTCCRSRGLPCKTHVKSTWVSAAKRRKRDHQFSLSTQQQNSDNQQFNLMITSGVSMPATHLYTTSGFPFPAEVSSSAVFQCVRVSGMDGTNEQLAYQTAFSVGGHIFNGVLYDHGPDQGQCNHPIGQSSSIGGGMWTTTTNPSITIINPSYMYPTSLRSFMAGTQSFQTPRS